MVKCSYCSYEGELKLLKTWKFRFYEVKRLECHKYHGVFSHYQETSPRGKKSEFVIRIKPRVVSE